MRVCARGAMCSALQCTVYVLAPYVNGPRLDGWGGQAQPVLQIDSTTYIGRHTCIPSPAMANPATAINPAAPLGRPAQRSWPWRAVLHARGDEAGLCRSVQAGADAGLGWGRCRFGQGQGQGQVWAGAGAGLGGAGAGSLHTAPGEQAVEIASLLVPCDTEGIHYSQTLPSPSLPPVPLKTPDTLPCRLPVLAGLLPHSRPCLSIPASGCPYVCGVTMLAMTVESRTWPKCCPLPCSSTNRPMPSGPPQPLPCARSASFAAWACA